MKDFLQFINQNFGYPNGGLYSNLIASAILGLVGFIYGRTFEKRSIKRHEEVLEAHRKTHEILKNK